MAKTVAVAVVDGIVIEAEESTAPFGEQDVPKKATRALNGIDSEYGQAETK